MKSQRQEAFAEGIAALAHELASPLGVLFNFVDDSRHGISMKEQDFLDARQASASLQRLVQELRRAVRCLAQGNRGGSDAQIALLQEFVVRLGYQLSDRTECMQQVEPGFFLRQETPEERRAGLVLFALLFCLGATVFCDTHANTIHVLLSESLSR